MALQNPKFAAIVEHALKQVAQIFEENEIPFILIGSVTSFLLGAGRESGHDCDFGLPPEQVFRAAQALENAGYRIEVPPECWLFKAWVPTPEGEEILVDLISEPSGIPITQELIDAAPYVSVFAHPMKILTPNQLLTMKLLSLREHGCDMSACLSIARSVREQIDWPALEEATKQSPYAVGFFPICKALGIYHDNKPISIITEFQADRTYHISNERQQLIEHLKNKKSV